MTQEFDPRKSYLSVKANEKMIAYVGIIFQLEDGQKSKEGIVKIAALRRPYGGGYLTLTFMIDKGRDEALKVQFEQICNEISEDALKPHLGNNFERMVRVDLDMLDETKGWYIEEINLYFRTIIEREKVLVEEMLLPALESTLPCKFQTVEWWPEGRKTEPQDKAGTEGPTSIKGLFKKWFGS
jgi:hypothetical protein